MSEMQEMTKHEPFNERLDLTGAEATQTLNQFFDEFYLPMAKAKNRSARHTEVTYEKHFRNTLGPVPWEEVNQRMLNAWLRQQIKKQLKNSTINKHLFLLNRLFKTAVDWAALPEGVVRLPSLDRLPTGDYRQRFLDQAEIKRLLMECDKIDHPYLSLFIRFLLLTGARKGEARTAMWRDIDFNVGVWRVPVSKNGRSRRIHLSHASLDVLHSTKARSRELGLPFGPTDYLFINPKTRTCYGSFHLAFFRARDAADLSDVRIHDLRHTFASLLINKGVSLYEVQELLGHSSAQMTQRYAHLQPNKLRRRTEIVSQIVIGP